MRRHKVSHVLLEDEIDSLQMKLNNALEREKSLKVSLGQLELEPIDAEIET